MLGALPTAHQRRSAGNAHGMTAMVDILDLPALTLTKFSWWRLLEYLKRCARENLYRNRILPIGWTNASKEHCRSPFKCFFVKEEDTST